MREKKGQLLLIPSDVECHDLPLLLVSKSWNSGRNYFLAQGDCATIDIFYNICRCCVNMVHEISKEDVPLEWLRQACFLSTIVRRKSDGPSRHNSEAFFLRYCLTQDLLIFQQPGTRFPRYESCP
jgi:hypothetical protein